MLGACCPSLAAAAVAAAAVGRPSAWSLGAAYPPPGASTWAGGGRSRAPFQCAAHQMIARAWRAGRVVSAAVHLCQGRWASVCQPHIQHGCDLHPGSVWLPCLFAALFVCRVFIRENLQKHPAQSPLFTRENYQVGLHHHQQQQQWRPHQCSQQQRSSVAAVVGHQRLADCTVRLCAAAVVPVCCCSTSRGMAGAWLRVSRCCTTTRGPGATGEPP